MSKNKKYTEIQYMQFSLIFLIIGSLIIVPNLVLILIDGGKVANYVQALPGIVFVANGVIFRLIGKKKSKHHV